MARCGAYPQPTGIKSGSRTDLQARRPISIAAHEEERRHLFQRLFAFHMRLYSEPEIAPHKRPCGEHERCALDISPALHLFPLAHKMRIEAYAGIVDEDAPVNLPDIHLRDLAGEEIANGGLEAQWNAGVLGKMVQCAHRQHAERGVGARQLAGQGVDRSVATPGHNRVAALAQGASGQRRDVVAPLGHDDLRLHAVFIRNALNMRKDRLQVNGLAVKDARWAQGYDWLRHHDSFVRETTGVHRIIDPNAAR